ncbi:glycosyl transferase GT17 family protein [Candidatus Woesearchaeota archaeon]|nr:glycosyl transferase GT17 family protein [Candidatus Woesearchaeota archaeon]
MNFRNILCGILWDLKHKNKLEKPKIYDCFLFFNELELLKLRFQELYDHVDYFVIGEATKTHSGKDKELYFLKNKQKFKKWQDKIIHVIIKDTPKIKNNDRWELEGYQKNQIRKGLNKCNNNDIILFSDADEIPNYKKIPEALELLKTNKVVLFKQRFYYYYLNGFLNNCWMGTVACKFKTLKYKCGCSLKQLRVMRRDQELKYIENGGWHFSYLASPEKIQEKISSFAHNEYDTEEYNTLEKIKNRIEKGEDLFGRYQKVNYVKIDETFPETIIKNKEKYSSLIKA